MASIVALNSIRGIQLEAQIDSIAVIGDKFDAAVLAQTEIEIESNLRNLIGKKGGKSKGKKGGESKKGPSKGKKGVSKGNIVSLLTSRSPE